MFAAGHCPMDQNVTRDIVKVAEEVVQIFLNNETPCRKKYEFTEFSFFQLMESALNGNVRAQIQRVLIFCESGWA